MGSSADDVSTSEKVWIGFGISFSAKIVTVAIIK